MYRPHAKSIHYVRDGELASWPLVYVRLPQVPPTSLHAVQGTVCQLRDTFMVNAE